MVAWYGCRDLKLKTIARIQFDSHLETIEFWNDAKQFGFPAWFCDFSSQVRLTNVEAIRDPLTEYLERIPVGAEFGEILYFLQDELREAWRLEDNEGLADDQSGIWDFTHLAHCVFKRSGMGKLNSYCDAFDRERERSSRTSLLISHTYVEIVKATIYQRLKELIDEYSEVLELEASEIAVV